MDGERKRKYDDLDIAILRELKINCKIHMRELAIKLGSHPNTVMQRIKLLEKEGTIKGYSAIIDYRNLGYKVYAIMHIQIEMNRTWEDMMKPITRIPEVIAAYAVTGDTDVIIIIQGKDIEDLTRVLREVQSKGIVMKTTTYMVVDTYKHHYEFNPLDQEGR